jgi:hypothetical protein
VLPSTPRPARPVPCRRRTTCLHHGKPPRRPCPTAPIPSTACCTRSLAALPAWSTAKWSRKSEKAFAIDPRDKWAAGDNWDYNHEPFLRTKQALTRATYLAPGLVACNLYMPAMVDPTKWQFVMNTVYGGKQMMTEVPSNAVAGDPSPELVQVFKTGQRLEVSKRQGEYSVLTPVYDSLGQITAVVEVFTRDAGFKQIRK